MPVGSGSVGIVVSTMVDASHEPSQLLREDVEAWNSWRREHRSTQLDLRGLDLSDLDLTGADLSEVDLRGADLFQTRLDRANVKMANLANCDLSGASFVGADLYKTDLTGCFATDADLSGAYLADVKLIDSDLRGVQAHGANLTGAMLTGSDLSRGDFSDCIFDGADVTDANLSQAILDRASIFGLEYGPRRSMAGHYFAVRGLDSCHGNAPFVRDAQDQDYIDTLWQSVDQLPTIRARRQRKLLLRAWKVIDYGRSLLRPAAIAFVLSMVFGLVYSLDLHLDWGLMDYSGTAQGWLTPFYYSIVTYTTLGFGDITPTHWVGELVVVVEVLLGYLTLGLLLTILANSVARRS